MKRSWIVLSLIVLEIVIFLFLRFYDINNSLFFFNDMGRDLLVLQNWRETGKIPLLGPQTSAMPFNQSAIYFYYLYPFYLISHASPLTALYANAFLYLTSFILGLFLLRRHPKYQQMAMFAFFLAAIHPQFISQSRFIWNPSLVTPFILYCLIAYLFLIKKYSYKLAILFSLSITAAVSLSYSIAPLLIVILGFSLFQLRKYLLPLAFFIFCSYAALNLPTIAFELKYKFVLTSAVLTQKSPPQKDIDLLSKLKNLSNFTVTTQTQTLNYVLLATIILLIIFSLRKSASPESRQISLMVIALLIATILLPITVQAHYIFGILCLFFLLFASLPKSASIFIVLISAILFLNPWQLNAYFKNAPRTYTQMQDCYKTICGGQKDPLFVTVQSSYHPYHHGPEHRYLMKNAGCNVQNIEDGLNLANLMAVVVDGGDYDHEATKYYELDIFGKSTVAKIYKCQDNFKVFILDKAKNETTK